MVRALPFVCIALFLGYAIVSVESACTFGCSTIVTTPVCGSDGKTYANFCEMTEADCADPSGSIHVMEWNACPDDVATNPPMAATTLPPEMV